MHKTNRRPPFYKTTAWLILLAACSLTVMGQEGSADSLAAQFTRYQTQHVQQEIYVHTDKTVYVTGETIWFKVYVMDHSLHRPWGLEKLAYAEIISRDQKPVLQAKIGLDSGHGHGYFNIPPGLRTGTYTLRAYTSWMKNFDPGFYFEAPLTLINTVQAPPAAEQARKPTSVVQFFPEGGNLVSGLASRVAFKVTGPAGQGLPAEGWVTGSGGDTVARLVTRRFGMGSFQFTPREGSTYQAWLKLPDTLLQATLPAAQPQGYVLTLQDSGNDHINLSIRASAAMTDPRVYLFIHTRQVIKYAWAARLRDGQALLSIDRKLLGDGISHITVFNQDRQPVCERLYFKKPDGQMQLTVKSDQPAYGTRKPVRISLESGPRPGGADLSLSVFRTDSLQDIPEENIVTYLMLTADLKGYIESPSFYLEPGGSGTGEAADLLMLTQGWSRFRWEEVNNPKTPFFRYLPELEGPLICGEIRQKATGRPAGQVTAFLSVPGRIFDLCTATSNASGDIRFNTHAFYGRSEVIIQSDSNYVVNINNPFSERFSGRYQQEFSLSRKWESTLAGRSLSAQVENLFLADRKHRLIPYSAADTLQFYGKPDLHYNLDDYTRFVTMEEVMREYVGDVRVRKQGEQFHFRVRNGLFNTFFEDDPLVLVDGVPVADISRIIAFDPLKIKSVDVISRKYYSGPMVNDGLVSYQTYDGDLAGFQLDPGALVLEYEGLQQQKEFYTPVYQTAQQQASRLPDQRNVLHWTPDIKTGPDGKSHLSFYTSDLKGTYIVLVQGLSADGLAGYGRLSFTVSD